MPTKPEPQPAFLNIANITAQCPFCQATMRRVDYPDLELSHLICDSCHLTRQRQTKELRPIPL